MSLTPELGKRGRFAKVSKFYKGPAVLRVDFALKDFSLCQRDDLKLGTTNERI